VTLVGGLRCNKGIVLLAETQETVGMAKRHVPKLRFEEISGAARTLSGNDLAVAFCGATNNGAFVDKLVDLAWQATQFQPDINSVCKAIEKSIEDTYSHYGTTFQPGYMPSAELIYGVKMQGESRLFHASDSIVNIKDEYCTGGVGAYIADFLAARMYTTGLSIQQCVILAAYILFQAKEHVDGCGGQSHIAVLREDGASGMVDSQRIEAITQNLQRADSELGGVLLASADLELSDKEFHDQTDQAYEFLKMWREEQKKDFQKWKQFREIFDKFYNLTINRNSLGLIQSIDETSEDQQ
jgi:20S proteasome alpha/beta subunit